MLLRFEVCEPRYLLAASLGEPVVAADYGPNPIFEEFSQYSMRKHLSASEETSYLQSGGNALRLIDSVESDGRATSVFQQLHEGIPVHGAYVTVIQNGDESFESYDRGYPHLSILSSTLPGYGMDEVGADWIDIGQAILVATDGLDLPANVFNDADLVWYHAGSQARLAWQVNTSTTDDRSTAELTTFVDAKSGIVLEQDSSPRDEAAYLLRNPETVVGVYPRIVINDAIGASGSRSYAAPFDAVVAISVGCSGTLIAPDVVISARHCGIGSGAQIYFGDNSTNPDYIATVDSSFQPDGNGTLLDGGDVSILRLTQSVPSNVAVPMKLTDQTFDLAGQVAATIGYGYNGVGSVGHGFSADGFRWGGENRIDAYGTPASQNGTNIISTDFDDGTSGSNTIGSSSAVPLAFEATTAPGDSGGPILVQVNNEWMIAGVLSGGTTNTSVYGDISWWTGVAPFRAEIESFGGQFAGPASVALDAEIYVAGDTVIVTVDDGNASGPLAVTLTSTSGDAETISLAGIGNSKFSGSIGTSGAVVAANDGILQVSAQDVITVTYLDSDDGSGGQVTLTDTATIAPGYLATGEQTSNGSIASGNFTSTFLSDGVSEVLAEERFGGRRSRLEHRWNFELPGGGQEVTFHLQARHNSSAENFDFQFSTNAGSSWESILRLDSTTFVNQSVPLGNALFGNILVRVIDTDRTRGESTLDSVFIDQMFFTSEPFTPVPDVLITQTGGSTDATEGGAGDSYFVALATLPTSDVTVIVSPDAQVDLGAGPGQPINLQFTALNALDPKEVIVNAVDDADVEFAHTGVITHATASADVDYNGLPVPSLSVAITDNDSTGGGRDVAIGEVTIDGVVSEGDFVSTHFSDDVRERIDEELYGGNKRTRMSHIWTFNVSGGSAVNFHLEAFRSSNTEAFRFDYSTNGGSSWTFLTTVTSTVEATEVISLGSLPSGEVLVRVTDTDRSRNERVIDSIYVDEMYFQSSSPDSSARNVLLIDDSQVDFNTEAVPATDGSSVLNSLMTGLTNVQTAPGTNASVGQVATIHAVDLAMKSTDEEGFLEESIAAELASLTLLGQERLIMASRN